MKKIFLPVAALIICAGLAAPARADDLFSTLLGAGLGGFIGSNIGHGSGRLVATGTGVFLGGLIGNSVGHSVERVHYRHHHHRPYAYYTYSYPDYYAAPAYSYSTYVPNYVAPPAPPPAAVYQGDYCREYTQRVVIGNHTEESYGTACLQPDGSWRVVQ